jgi:hypothetical protein
VICATWSPFKTKFLEVSLDKQKGNGALPDVGSVAEIYVALGEVESKILYV